MRHRKSGRKLGRTTSHRLALFRNMLASLVEHEKITTTLPKAKDLRHFADKMITLAKKNDVPARRQAFSFLRSRDLVKKLFDDLGPKFHDRQGGYTRIYRLGFRAGDAAPMAIIEYLAEATTEKKEEKPKKAKKASSKK